MAAIVIVIGVSFVSYQAIEKKTWTGATCRVVDTRGRLLAGLFSGIPPSANVVKSLTRFFPKQVSCSGSRSGPKWGRQQSPQRN